jgi:indolepyruvate decarboxylase
MPSEVQIGDADYGHVKMSDVLGELVKRLHKRTDVGGPVAKRPTMPKVDAENPITADYLYARCAKFFKPDDIIIADSSTSFFGLLPVFLPKGVKFESQMLWGQ